MLSTSISLVVNAAINKAGLKEEPCHIHFSKEDNSFPLVISFRTEENDYTLHIFYELIEELSSTAHALRSGHLLDKKEWANSLFPEPLR